MVKSTKLTEFQLEVLAVMLINNNQPIDELFITEELGVPLNASYGALKSLETKKLIVEYSLVNGTRDYYIDIIANWRVVLILIVAIVVSNRVDKLKSLF